jgi:hypothetical protein
MSAPQVRYCQTTDGVNIAYTVSGSGSPLLWVGEPVISHAELAWTHPVFGPLYERIADKVMLVRYDAVQASPIAK